MRVPFFRVSLSEAEIQAAERVLRSGWLTTGQECELFEREFADAIGQGVEAVAVNSNTAGMHLALEALGITKGDEVILPVLTFTATAEVVRYLGADPVFADIDPVTLCLTPDAAKAKITPRTKAIMPVHFAGVSCDITSFNALAEKHRIAIVEDAAHSFPSSHNGVNIGGHGTKATVFSFYANKTITTGEGGMIVSADKPLIRRVRTMRLHGIDRDVFRRHTDDAALWRYDVIAPGFKYNLTDIAAAIGRGQLRRAGELRSRRMAISERYNRAFAKFPVRPPALPPAGDDQSYHLYILQLEEDAPINRDRLLAFLEKRGVGYSVHYTPLHQMSYWKEQYGLRDTDFPVASDYVLRCASLPLFPSMTDDEVEYVIEAVQDAFR